jgi:hypothetical protein
MLLALLVTRPPTTQDTAKARPVDFLPQILHGDITHGNRHRADPGPSTEADAQWRDGEYHDGILYAVLRADPPPSFPV